MAQIVGTCKDNNVAVGHPHVNAGNVERILSQGYRFLMAAPVRSTPGLDRGLELAGRKAGEKPSGPAPLESRRHLFIERDPPGPLFPRGRQHGAMRSGHAENDLCHVLFRCCYTKGRYPGNAALQALGDKKSQRSGLFNPSCVLTLRPMMAIMNWDDDNGR